jgi:hypothetical protein
MLFECGQTSQDRVPGAEAANAGAGGQGESVGPINSDGLPASMPMLCPNRAEALAFQLPCAVGLNLSGAPDQPGFHVVECELAGMPSQVAVSFIVPLKELPNRLGKTVALPFDGAPPPPPGLGVQLGGQSFTGNLAGDITFEQVDLQGRAFVAHLERGMVNWSGALGGGFECSVVEGPLWAVAGSFL